MIAGCSQCLDPLCESYATNITCAITRISIFTAIFTAAFFIAIIMVYLIRKKLLKVKNGKHTKKT